MSEQSFPDPGVPVDSMDAETLKGRIDDAQDVTVLDVRAESEYETWHVDGERVTDANVPYFEFLEGATDELLERVPEAPDGEPIVVVCAKGQSSEFVAGLLKQEGIDAVNLADGMNGWARLYEAAELDADTDATVLQYRRPSSGCLAYLVVSDGEAAVVDPLRAFADRYVEDAREYGAELRYAADTHVHADHVSGARELAERGVELVFPAPAAARGVEFDTEYRAVEDGDSLTVGSVEIDVLHTPGHTSGMTSYLVDDAVLLTGDTLFTESVARPDLEEGDEGAPEAAARLHETLQERILTLPEDVLVAPAHFGDAATPREDGTYAAHLGDLDASMSVLSMDRDEFVEFVRSDMPPRPANYETIIATNLGREEVGDNRAFELELGPNNCAASSDAMTSD
ncbi:MBL fold metallo-hydrolase [Halomarina litorea]|uniref:MBL fold metallo-hydrolase n=1 Tax=Halomarina litorea TaxID=2961595 RepID=UPI0020C5A0F3|nr:MBL fold metallo-hydrolase [Halomarina sp. BCD28]